jgi:hypothetical protein
LVETDPIDPGEDVPARPRPWWQRKNILISAVVVVAVAAVAVGVLIFVTSDNPPAVVASAPALVPDRAVAAARAGVLKIHGEAADCHSDGTGVVVAPNRVMSVAVTVAGMEALEVDDGQNTYPAHVVSFDPKANIAILEVPELPTAPLEFDTQGAVPETDALVLGYPDGGDLATTTARIQETILLKGPDIYHADTVSREVYILKGSVGEGDGPVIGRDGRMLGIVFGADMDDPDTGFALTAHELTPQMSHVGDTKPVPTQACTE